MAFAIPESQTRSRGPARIPGEPEINVSIVSGVPTFSIGSLPVAALAESGKTRAVYQLYRDNRNFPVDLQALEGRESGLTAFYEGGGYVVRDRIEKIGPRVFRCERTWWNRTGKEQNIVLSVEVYRDRNVDFYMIPGISYNGNGRWPKAAFQGLTAPGMSPGEAAESIAGNHWIIPGDRGSLPACSITEAGGSVVGLFSDPADASFSACSMEERPSGFVQRLWWPQQDQPFRIAGTTRHVQAPWETVFLWPGDSCTRSFTVVIGQTAEPRTGYTIVLDEAWKLYEHPVPRRHTPERLWELGIRFAKESLWVDSEEFQGFSFSLEPLDGGYVQAGWPWRFELGFVGQAASIGAFMIQDSIARGDADSWHKGKTALDFWAENGRLSNGLLYPRFDDKLAWKTDPDVDTRNMGDGAYFYLLASELAEKAGKPQPSWRETGLGICDFFVRNALPDGRFGKKWKASGRLVDGEGTIGAYVLPALIKAYRLTGREAYLRTAERAFRAYADGDLEAVSLTAGAIDQDTIDKETGYPLLDAGLDLYAITGKAYFLEKAEKAAYYLASWQYHYSIAFPPGSPAADLDYDAFGGTSITVGGGGADQGGAVIVLGWLRLWKATGKDIWRQRALAAWGHTTTGVSDGHLVLNGKKLPAGAQYEGFQHSRTRRTYSSRQDYGTEWLCAWCTAFRLWTLHHWPDWKDLE